MCNYSVTINSVDSSDQGGFTVCLTINTLVCKEHAVIGHVMASGSMDSLQAIELITFMVKEFLTTLMHIHAYSVLVSSDQ